MATNIIQTRQWVCKVTTERDLQLDKAVVLTTWNPQDLLKTEVESRENLAGDNLDGFFSCLSGNRDSCSSVSSSSSSDSERPGSTLVRRDKRTRMFKRLWDRDTLFSLQSVKNPISHRDVYHVVTDTHSALSSLIRAYDRILEINEVDVKQMSEEEMDRVLERVANFSVVKLKTWRWEQCEGGHKIQERHVVIRNTSPGHPVPQMLREFSMLSLNDRFSREVKNFKWHQDDFIPYHIHIASVTGLYVYADTVDMTLKGKPMTESHKSNDQFRFLVRFFNCMVTDDDHVTNIRYGFVAQFGRYDVIGDSNVLLREHTDYNTEKLDERFILELQVQKEDNIFESLLYKNVFMKYNNETGMLTMNYSKRQGPTYRFQTFRTRGPVPQSTVSDTNGGDLFVFERIIENKKKTTTIKH